MPYIISPVIDTDVPGLWAEGSAYSRETIYDLCSPDPQSPPVNYSSHLLKPHSICHFDAPSHIIPDGATIDRLIEASPEVFYGPTVVVRLKDPKFLPHSRASSILHWEISLRELISNLRRIKIDRVEKILITFEGAEKNFYQDSHRALTLSEEAARWLKHDKNVNLFGTVWKSTDFQPGLRERPIHKIFFENGSVLECLNLSEVPEGNYFLSAFPLYLKSSSESPVCPVLFSENEIRI
jgi:kynurenine formamidase